MEKQDRITQERLEKYREITEKALVIAKKSINKDMSKIRRILSNDLKKSTSLGRI